MSRSVYPRSRLKRTRSSARVTFGKIWIRHDGTNRPVADELVRAGVPREAIVLAFHPPYAPVHTDQAVG